jgi:hypothetical protein
LIAGVSVVGRAERDRHGGGTHAAARLRLCEVGSGRGAVGSRRR